MLGGLGVGVGVGGREEFGLEEARHGYCGWWGGGGGRSGGGQGIGFEQLEDG